ncbi:MAG: AbrB/MazE/SpoVT family DNA-binding domain-containing protein [Burkholderiaceae bacterium]|jgi:antitoxin component of MazEF toxin-antitoxin module|nr:AbrB/MazE/SpoVT family DNA-binding domain-containing protein [Burkholderiaceae bacterium]
MSTGITIARWGNSAGMRIPSVVLRQAGLKVGDRVQTEVQGEGAIVIRVAPRKAVDIAAMIARITPDTLPDAHELDDAPVGREVW